MLSVVPFKVEHLKRLAEHEQVHSAYLRAYAQPADLLTLENAPSWSVVADDAIIACGGAIPRWPHSAQLWAYLGTGRPQQFLFIHKRVVQFLNECVYTRVEALVRTDFDKGHQWMRLLGLEMEAPRMKLYGPDQMDYSLYARTR